MSIVKHLRVCLLVLLLCQVQRSHSFRAPLPRPGSQTVSRIYKTATEPASKPPFALPPQKPTTKTWMRRLNTREDKLSLHKISGVGFVLSSTFILLVGLQSGFREIPEWLQLADASLVLFSVVLATSSLQMAFSHRKRQPWIRDQFVAMAFVAVFSVLAEELMTPFTPMFLQTKAISDPLFLILTVGYSGYTLRGLGDKEKLLQHSKPGMMTEINYFLGIPCQVVGQALATLPLLQHDREWLQNFTCSFIGSTGVSYYGQVFLLCCTMYSALLLTLKDKKLIDPSTEAKLAAGIFSAISLFTAPFVWQYATGTFA